MYYTMLNSTHFNNETEGPFNTLEDAIKNAKIILHICSRSKNFIKNADDWDVFIIDRYLEQNINAEFEIYHSLNLEQFIEGKYTK